MKVKRILLSLLLIISSIFVFIGCANDKILAKPEDTTLEFWIAQDVSNVDFSEYYPIIGMFGGSQYYGKGYEPISVDDEQVYIHPPCVIYTITAYPDYADGGQFVTGIKITDPQISIYGITCNSTLQDFDKTFENLGCTIQDVGSSHVATYKKVKIALSSYNDSKTLTVWVEVTNNYGIVF